MKKKWLAVIPAVALVASPLSIQPASASSEQIEQESDVPSELESVLNIAPEHQPTLTQGSTGTYGNEVDFVQFTISQAGFETEVDGVFGKDTDEKVKKFQAEHDLTVDGVVGLNTWTALFSEHSEQSFPVESAISYAEEALDNDDLIFSSNGVLHEDSEGNAYYSLRAQSQGLIDGGGTGTVGYYDVYENGDVVESEPQS
ncbi:peptidoglycan-binding domain-containing protein [Alkalicoccobacillus murimartini]|uniref:Peptidoglycan hydrolase-like protein with peptidoglycan-binding domain n=1 Tax=Alkalicoccobacillus murimartini TaxID=171685 RepID=A0ABT9YI15_9BACI|nr:peptidoglycan-binding domain-containing protein [Alkalicoccobacillus murimartini]MDQ0207499.1 peptidoglycan hydrolase-like protein with peptidoglycan-binding domain [Alkalicoccobacillus murimartini]